MWNAPPNEVKASDIAMEHWRVLADAIASRHERDPRSRTVYTALDYFRARAVRQGGVNLIEAGLSSGNSEQLQSGLTLLRQHLGGVLPG